MNPGDTRTTSGDDPTVLDRLTDLVVSAWAKHQSGAASESIELAEKAQQVAAAASLPLDPQSAVILNRIGMIFFFTGYNRRALAAYEDALSVLKKLDRVPDDHFADLYNNLGQVETRLGNMKQARTWLESAVSIREKQSTESVELGRVRDNLGGVYSLLGDLDKAEATHLRAIDILERLQSPISDDVATALGNMSSVYLRRKDFQAARACQLRALDTHLRTKGPRDANTLTDIHRMVKINLEADDDASADRYLNILLSVLGDSAGKEHRFLAEMLRTLASDAFNDFRLDLAERICTQAVAALEATEGPTAPETLEMIRLLANVHRATGNTRLALKHCKRALAGYQEIGDEEAAARVMIDLGKQYCGAGSFPLAKEFLEAAVDQFSKGPSGNSQQRASALGNLAVLYYKQEDYDRADSIYLDALKETDDEEAAVERPWLLYNRAQLRYHLGDYELAKDLYEEAKDLYAKTSGDDHPHVATTAWNLGLVHWAVGKSDRARILFAEATALRDREMRRVLAVGSEVKRLAYAKDLLSDLHVAISFYFTEPQNQKVGEFVAEMLLRRKGRVLDAIAHTLLNVRDNIPEEDRAIVARLDSVRKEISDLLAPVLGTQRAPGTQDRLASLKNEEEELEAKLSYQAALYQPGLEPVTLDYVREMIPADAALVEFVRFTVFEPKRAGKSDCWTEEHYAAMVLRPDTSPRWYDLGLASTIDKQSKQLLKLVRRRASKREEWQAEATKLYALVIEPMKDALEGTRHLLVSPDGKMSLTPFGLLVDGEGRRLSEHCLVSYLTSGRELASAPADPSADRGAVIIAAPDFDTAAETEAIAPTRGFAGRGKRFAPLEGAREEGEQLHDLLDGATLVMGADATIDALKDVRNPNVLHIATHGIFSPMDEPGLTWNSEVMSLGDQVVLINQAAPVPTANPMFYSALAFAGANQKQGDRGLMTGQEIASLDLRGTELVVLSACETGLGTAKSGEEFTGLRRAISIAGGKTQLTSLWRVDDEATRALMVSYYEFLLEGYGRAEALARAQDRVEKDAEHPEWKHPFYWGAFVSSGRWEEVASISKRESSESGRRSTATKHT